MTTTTEVRPPRRPRPALPLIVAVGGVLMLIVVTGLTLAARRGTTVDPAPLTGTLVTALTEAAMSCPALTPARLAGQVMATTGFTPTREGGVGGLSAEQWETWKPDDADTPDDARSSLLALARLTCDMVGQVRAAAVDGDSWRLAVAALRSSVDEVVTTRGVPERLSGFMAEVDRFTTWYAIALGPASPQPNLESAPVPSVSPSLSSPSSSPTPTRTAARPGTTSKPPAVIAPPPVRIGQTTFTSASGLRLNGSAQVSGGRLNLTTGLDQAGSAWSTTTIETNRSLTASFTAVISQPTDGLALVIQAEGPAALGGRGGGIGYGARPADSPADQIRPSVAIELDTWDNSPDGYDPAGRQHIAVTTNGDITKHLVWGDPGIDMRSNTPVYVWLTYDVTTHRLTVYGGSTTTRPATPVLTLTLNLRGVLGAAQAHIGFTAATGRTNLTESRESILAWSVVSG